MKILAVIVIFSICILGVQNDVLAQDSERQGSYNVRSSTDRAERPRTRSLYSSNARRSSTNGANIYSSTSSSSSSGSQPLSINNILSGNYEPKRVIRGFNDRSENFIPYASKPDTRSSSSYTTEELNQMRRDRIMENEERARQAQESYQQRIARRMEELKERERILSERSLQNIPERYRDDGTALLKAEEGQAEEVSIPRRQVYRGALQETTNERLFNSVR
ncbi:MAG: hypothetical protein AAF569_01765 [Pseudomonadota bacterium]